MNLSSVVRGYRLVQDEAAARATQVAEKILSALSEPHRLEAGEYACTPSIGVALFNRHVGSAKEMLRRADIAMYQAREAGRNTVRFFDPELQQKVDFRVALKTELRQALVRAGCVAHRGFLFSRPLPIEGFEALVRGG